MLKNLSIILITLTILWGCADEMLLIPTGNQLKGAIKTFVLKAPIMCWQLQGKAIQDFSGFGQAMYH